MHPWPVDVPNGGKGPAVLLFVFSALFVCFNLRATSIHLQQERSLTLGDSPWLGMKHVQWLTH